MRLWHKKLIPALPRQQLIAQWRECSAIAGAIAKNGTPNHVLVNKVLDYDFDEFITYSSLIRAEMLSRGYKITNTVWNKITSLKSDWKPISTKELFKNWHNQRYLWQCYYNLEEKFDCGMITEEEFSKIAYKTFTIEEEI